MPIYRAARRLAFAVGVALGTLVPGGPSFAVDAKLDATAVFAAAFAAYSDGDIALALERYREAASMGHLPASWKLARMYESGEGAERSDVLAHETYRAIAERYGSIRPGDRDAVYVASAFVRLGHYARLGIENFSEPDPALAERAYFYAASYFGDTDAQFELGRMIIVGSAEGAELRNGLRWLKSAADKGDARASAVLGAALFRGRGIKPRHEEGLVMLLRASDAVREVDRGWVHALRDDVLEEATIDTVRTARALAGKVEEGSS